MADFKEHGKMVKEEYLDFISQLPETLLVRILSCLSIKEAARTSVLARHWRHRWLFVVDEFDFDFDIPRDLEMPLDAPALKGRYFEWVNQLLRSHRDHVDEASVISKLRFQFPFELDEWCYQQIDGWISYAFARRVQSLELDFPSNDSENSYCFPRRLVTETDDLSCLRSLSLSYVSVSREDIDAFLFKFRFLERLKVCAAPKLDGIEIGSSSPALKHLEIVHCDSLKYATVRNTNLVSFTFTSMDNLFLENNPNLVSVCISQWYTNSGPILQMISSCLSRLQILTLCLDYKSDESLDQVAQLSELRKLTLIAAPMVHRTAVRATALLNISPKLETLVLDFVLEERDGELSYMHRRYLEYRRCSRFPLQHLKDVEVRGYYGTLAEHDLIEYILGVVLPPIERIIFDPRNLRREFSSPPHTLPSAEERVKLFRKAMPSTVHSAELIVL